MKNSPLTRLLAAAALVLASTLSAAESQLIVAMLPKSKGNAYFVSCKAGADRAARDLGVKLLFDGPTDSNAAKQNEIVENWITLGVDVIAVAAENREGISPRCARPASRASRSSLTTPTPSPTPARSSSTRPRRRASRTR